MIAYERNGKISLNRTTRPTPNLQPSECICMIMVFLFIFFFFSFCKMHIGHELFERKKTVVIAVICLGLQFREKKKKIKHLYIILLPERRVYYSRCRILNVCSGPKSIRHRKLFRTKPISNIYLKILTVYLSIFFSF